MPRDMTEDELRRFEEEELHHTDEEEAVTGPASESDIAGTREQWRPPSGDPEVPPLNPD